MDGDPVQISMHSNLIYSSFDPRFNVVSLPFIFNSPQEADAKLDGAGGKKLNEILSSYGLHCMGMAENGFRELTNSKRPVKSIDDIKNLKIRVAGSNLLMKCYELWGADGTNMNWSETYTALQQNTVDGQENPYLLLMQLVYRKFKSMYQCGMQIMIAYSSVLIKKYMMNLLLNSKRLLMNVVNLLLNTKEKLIVPEIVKSLIDGQQKMVLKSLNTKIWI